MKIRTTISGSIITNSGHVTTTENETLHYLEGVRKFSDGAKFPIPAIVLLDLHLPSPDGFAILQWRQGRVDFSPIFFVAVSDFKRSGDINRPNAFGADSFLVKPIDVSDLQFLIGEFESYWALRDRHSMERRATNRS